jgi:drug/metabolite transporter (DMT)-like permease
MPYLGETAGLLTSLFFAINAVVITRAGAQVGSVVLNRTRVVFALLYLILLNLILFHEPLPFHAGATRWTWLALSGLIGLAIGDAFLFQAYLSIGPRLGSLLLSLSTVFGVLEAWLFFGEHLRLGQLVGIALCLGGIVWVVAERSFQPPPSTGLESGLPANGTAAAHHISPIGILFGVLAAAGQATGLVFSGQGMHGSFSPISGNVIRMLAAVVALWLVALVQRQAGSTIRTLRLHPSAVRLLALAALIGPVIGVSLSLLAVQNTAVGIASVLTSLSPIFMLPFSHFFFKERLGWQPIAGTFLAMAGVIILFLT